MNIVFVISLKSRTRSVSRDDEIDTSNDNIIIIIGHYCILSLVENFMRPPTRLEYNNN